MSGRKDPSGRRDVALELDVPGTPGPGDVRDKVSLMVARYLFGEKAPAGAARQEPL